MRGGLPVDIEALRAAIAADHWVPMLRETAGFPTVRTDSPMNAAADIGFRASVRLKGIRMGAFEWQDEFRNTYKWTGDQAIEGPVSADDGGRGLGDQETVATKPSATPGPSTVPAGASAASAAPPSAAPLQIPSTRSVKRTSESSKGRQSRSV